MKAYTDLEQSKKLVEILPVKSADMCFVNDGTSIKIDANPYNVRKHMWKDVQLIPCWSLAALLDVLPSATLDSSNDHYYRIHCMERFSEWYDNAIDACVAMIEKLHKLKIL
jgi:hypothetical protein